MVDRTGQEKPGLRDDKDPKYGLAERQRWGTVCMGVSKNIETKIQRRDEG